MNRHGQISGASLLAVFASFLVLLQGNWVVMIIHIQTTGHSNSGFSQVPGKNAEATTVPITDVTNSGSNANCQLNVQLGWPTLLFKEISGSGNMSDAMVVHADPAYIMFKSKGLENVSIRETIRVPCNTVVA